MEAFHQYKILPHVHPKSCFEDEYNVYNCETDLRLAQEKVGPLGGKIIKNDPSFRLSIYIHIIGYCEDGRSQPRTAPASLFSGSSG
jgi:hypothetical protein